MGDEHMGRLLNEKKEQTNKKKNMNKKKNKIRRGGKNRKETVLCMMSANAAQLRGN